MGGLVFRYAHNTLDVLTAADFTDQDIAKLDADGVI
jgi:hypothetical protein